MRFLFHSIRIACDAAFFVSLVIYVTVCEKATTSNQKEKNTTNKLCSRIKTRPPREKDIQCNHKNTKLFCH